MSNIFLRSVLLKMQATKKQAFPTKNRLPADKFLFFQLKSCQSEKHQFIC